VANTLTAHSSFFVFSSLPHFNWKERTFILSEHSTFFVGLTRVQFC